MRGSPLNLRYLKNQENEQRRRTSAEGEEIFFLPHVNLAFLHDNHPERFADVYLGPDAGPDATPLETF